jgi:GNAT superfamily N-acetyltransferase
MRIETKSNWKSDLNNVSPLILGMLFSGDRFSCCDEALVGYDAKDQFIGIVTISSKGEQYNGQPDIIGLYVNPIHRKKGYGLALLQAAIRRCIERELPTPFGLTIVSSNMTSLYRQLPLSLKSRVKLVDLSLGMILPG